MAGESNVQTLVTLNIDGASRGNPGPAGIGVVLRENGGLIQAEWSEYLGIATNNVAEYRALLRGLELALQAGAKAVMVLTDSELLVRQINGEYRVRNGGLKPLHARALALLARFSPGIVRHIPRTDNVEADALANRGIDAARKRE